MKKSMKALNTIAVIILIPILFVNVVILINSYIRPNEIPSFFGWKPFIVLSGSMESQINMGDLVIVKETEQANINNNDIIAFRSGDLVVTHRIIDEVVEENETKYVTKGDNNNSQDNEYVSYENIEGVYMFKVSGLGNLAIFIQTPIGMLVALSIPIMLLLLLQVIESKKYVTNKTAREIEMQEEIDRLKKQNKELDKK